MFALPKAYAFEWRLHRSITGHALAQIGFSNSAIDDVADGNIYIDRQEGSTPASHADSEAFEATSTLLRSRLKIAAKAIQNNDMKNARATFGYITHTVQDFYAHTNYVEIMPGKSIDLLNLTNPTRDIICTKKNGLTSGYYPDSTTPPKKCSHSKMNMDSGNETPNGAKAVVYAEKATVQMYELLEKEVLSISVDHQHATLLMNRFKGEKFNTLKQSIFNNQDDVDFTAYNETFKISPFLGLTQMSSENFELESSFTSGVKFESRSNERFITGLGFTYSSLALKEYGIQTYDYESYGLDLYGKLYLITDSRLQPYAGIGLGYFANTLKHKTMLEKNTNTINGEVLGGVDLMFTRKIGLNIEFKYIKPLFDSSNSFTELAADKLAHDLNNSNNLLLSFGMIFSF